MTNKKRRIGAICILIFIFLLIFSILYQREIKSRNPITATAFKLNTVVTVTIYDSQDTSLLDEALALCDYYEEIFSRTKETSELYRLNHGTLPKGSDGFLISSELEELIRSGLSYGELSKGAFDIAIEPVSSLWDFTSGEKIVPQETAIQTALPLVNDQDVLLNNHQLSFQKEGMGLDLGAIAKGFISDRIKDFLVSKGIKSATINLGGNVLCIGNRPGNTPFRIGIQKPFADRNETAAVIEITDKSVISSGIYERYFEKDGTLYHHILNPKTGYPCDTSLVSVTIITEHGVDGDGLSTTCFALGLEKGMELINSLPDVQAVFITDDYQLHYSDNFKEEIHILS